MNEEEIRLIKGYFNDGYCCDLDELKDIANKMINENQQLKKQKYKAIHRIQLLQMDEEVTIRDLGLIVRDLKGDSDE